MAKNSVKTAVVDKVVDTSRLKGVKKRAAVVEMTKAEGSGLGRLYRREIEKSVKNYVEKTAAIIEKNSVVAANRLAELVSSDREDIALNAAKYTIDRNLGKPTSRNFSRVERINIDILAG